jgi:hypothetical protein
MRRLVFSILALLALFSVLRAYTESATGVQLHPGIVEIGDGASSVGIEFGVMEKTGQSLWNLLPLRVVYRSGARTVSLGLNGLSFVLRGGATVGRPVAVTTPVTGDLISVGGTVTVSSRVDGDVWTLGADVELGPKAEVTGSIVALGGRVKAAAGSVVRGSVNQVPELKIPFLGFLGTQFSVQVLSLGRQLLGYLLLGFALLLSSFYRTRRARGLYASFDGTWRESVVTTVIALVVVPLLAVLLVMSVVGIFFLPILVFALVLLGLEGFMVLCARLGGMLRRLPPEGGSEPLSLFTSGLLGLFLVKAPAFIGIFLTLVHAGVANVIGQILQLITLAAMAAGMLYGFGASMAFTRGKKLAA